MVFLQVSCSGVMSQGDDDVAEAAAFDTVMGEGDVGKRIGCCEGHGQPPLGGEPCGQCLARPPRFLGHEKALDEAQIGALVGEIVVGKHGLGSLLEE